MNNTMKAEFDFKISMVKGKMGTIWKFHVHQLTGRGDQGCFETKTKYRDLL